MIMAFASRQIAVPLLDNDTQSTRRHFTGNPTNQALARNAVIRCDRNERRARTTKANSEASDGTRPFGQKCFTD